MNLKLKTLILFLLLTVLLITGCSQEPTPYQVNDAEDYTVSIQYDANGGIFTTNTSVITDSYNISGMETNAQGLVELPLCKPDDPAREKNAFAPAKNGYFLAGWYTQRTETGTNEAGEPVYTYGGKWDFEKDRFSVDPSGGHSSAEPVLTLYAAWIPLFQIEVYDLHSGELTGTVTYDPQEGAQNVPQWDEETGAVNMFKFPDHPGHTFNGAYYDEAGKNPVQTQQLVHTGVVDEATGTVQGSTMKLYVDWLEGEWYHIYNVEQFLDNASVSGSYIIHEDLDFAGEIWPSSLMHGNYTGTIEGNGHTFQNITFEQTNNSKTNGGLFGYLTETAALKDVTFKNVTFTIKNGTRMAGTSYGLLAGTVSDQATLTNVKIVKSTLQIDSGCYFGTDDYSIGLVSGMGETGIDYKGITCKATGDAPQTVVITVNDATVTVEFVTE
ncbi:MAG: hypothetical protein IJO28_00965 [Oscillospiraceae bacterium]|nr:hypothetical protein [Oscillospiraceae bacterium]